MARRLLKKTTPAAPTAPELVEPVELEEPKDRHEVMKDYASRQAERGHQQVKLWVPEACVPWLHRLADDMRQIAELGFNPLTAHKHLPAVAELPKVLLVRRNWAREAS